MLKRIFIDTWRNTNEASLHFLQSAGGKKADVKVITVCITAALSLSAIYYFGDPDMIISLLRSAGMTDLAEDLNTVLFSKGAQLNRLAYWVGILVLFYFFLPAIITRFMLRESFDDYGLKPHGAFKDYRIYALMLVVMIPLVWYFSGTASFLARYPFYKMGTNEGLWPNFWIWQGLYFIQFCAVEYFFRGFMLHGTKQRFGFYSVFVMTIPYCMIHFEKPMPETIAAIIAGIVLGTLSLKSCSIWLGIAIHYTVALSMDLAALLRKGIL